MPPVPDPCKIPKAPAERVVHHDNSMVVFYLGHRCHHEISPTTSKGHEYILVAINYFTKLVEAESYAKLNVKKVEKIQKNIICRCRVLIK